MEKTMSVHKFLFAFALTFLLLTIVLPLDGFSQLPCARGRVKVIHNGNCNFSIKQYDPNGPGRTVVTDQGTLLRAYNAWHYFPSSETNWTTNRASWSNARKYGLNTVRLAISQYMFPNLSWNEFISRIDRYVNWAQEEHLYIIIDYHEDPGHYSFNRAKNFWQAVAPHYKNRTHVLYELLTIRRK
jgi:hypothetical protein